MKRTACLTLGLTMALSLVVAGMAFAGDGQQGEPQTVGDDGQSATNRCRLASNDGQIKHIVHIQFDNVHFRRDIPNVPSDLEQMPNLLRFLEDNGTILGNHHTPLISHTSVDILTTLAGTYGEKMGIPIGNTILFFNADGSSTFKSSFGYWTDALEPATANSPAEPL